MAGLDVYNTRRFDQGSVCTPARSSESPMDFEYTGGGPLNGVNSAFGSAMAATRSANTPQLSPSRSSVRRQPTDYQGPTPYHTPLFSTVRPRGFSTPRGGTMTTPTPTWPSLNLPDGSPMEVARDYPDDDDVVMLSSITKRDRTLTDVEMLDDTTNYATTEIDKLPSKESSPSRKLFRSSKSKGASHGSSPYLMVKEIFNNALSPRKSKNRKISVSGTSDADEDDESDHSGWILQATMTKSPKKVRRDFEFQTPRRTVSAPAHIPPPENPSLLAVLARHDNLPLVFAQYLQLMFNLFMVMIMLYLVTSFVFMVRSEVRHKAEEYTQRAIVEITLCTKEYLKNNCMPETRIPYMEVPCGEWQKCMNREASDVGHASVSVEVIADILNSFVERISYKTMAFLLVLTLGAMYISSSRVIPATNSRGAIDAHAQERIVYHQPPPATSQGDLATALIRSDSL
ncbi:Di-sulfide bridge nucleocytoplasmic transport domain-containing protein [Limtongia smithiae]|uniref:Di-sulfide bridge nucleocytoplasmic transport domain-containing protein n=1 Tax=Limtongia smithiae TaxID=1125753 RepID=UPI0034CDE30F